MKTSKIKTQKFQITSVNAQKRSVSVPTLKSLSTATNIFHTAPKVMADWQMVNPNYFYLQLETPSEVLIKSRKGDVLRGYAKAFIYAKDAETKKWKLLVDTSLRNEIVTVKLKADKVPTTIYAEIFAPAIIRFERFSKLIFTNEDTKRPSLRQLKKFIKKQ